MAKRLKKQDKRDKADREASVKKSTREIRAHLRKLLADNLDRVGNISADDWAAASALDEPEL